MINKCNAHCLIVDGKVVARGSAREMQRLRKKLGGGRVGLGFGPVGSVAKTTRSF